MRKLLKLTIILAAIVIGAPACDAQAQQTAVPAPFPVQITSGTKRSFPTPEETATACTAESLAACTISFMQP